MIRSTHDSREMKDAFTKSAVTFQGFHFSITCPPCRHRSPHRSQSRSHRHCRWRPRSEPNQLFAGTWRPPGPAFFRARAPGSSALGRSGPIPDHSASSPQSASFSSSQLVTMKHLRGELTRSDLFSSNEREPPAQRGLYCIYYDSTQGCWFVRGMYD